MVQVQSTWFPVIDRNPGRFMNIYKAQPSDYVKTTQRVYRSPRQSSHIVLNVLR
jgi:predicted acyl esterase